MFEKIHKSLNKVVLPSDIILILLLNNLSSIKKGTHNDQEVFCCCYFDFPFGDEFNFKDNMCHENTNHEILQKDPMTSGTSPLRVSDFNLVETNTKDASSKS